MALTKVKGHIIADDLALGGNPTTSTQSTGNNTTRLATTAFVQTELSALVDSSPSALNTLNELAAALGDDANFSTTVTNSIALKAPLANPDFTGQIQVSNAASTIQELTVTGNNTRSTLRLNSKDSSGGAVDLRMHSLGDGPRGEIFTFSNHDLAFATNNAAPQMTLKTDGKLGIGTTNPSATLDVEVSSNVFAGEFKQTNTSNGDGVHIRLGSAAAADYALRVDSDAGNTAGFVVKADGNVGIGTFTPNSPLVIQASHQLTDVTGMSANSTLVVGNTGSGNNVYNALHFSAHQQSMFIAAINHGTEASRRLGFFLGSAGGDAVADERLSITGNGNVGIGVINPVSKLHVVRGNDSDGSIRFQQTAATNNPVLFIEQIGQGGNTNTNQGLLIKVDGQNGGYGNIIRAIGTNSNVNGGVDVEALVVKNDGKVGIGTTAPGHPLSVRAANAKITAESTGDSQTVGFQAKYLDHSTLYGSFEYTTGDAQLYIDNHFAGNNGVYSDINFRNKDTSGNFHNRMKIKGSTGNVGIGTASPGYQLHIAGGGDFLVEDTGNGSAHIRLRSSSGGTASSNWKLKTSNNNFFYIDNDTGSAGTAIAIDNTGNVGINTAAPKSMHATSTSGATTMTVAGTIGSGYPMGEGATYDTTVPRIYRDWFMYNSAATIGSNIYVHMKTNLWGGGSPAGNTEFTMSHFRYHGYYAYGGDTTPGGHVGWHNWSGSFYNGHLVNEGTLALAQSSYVSSDGYVVLVAKIGAGYAQFSIDWHQWAGYAFRERKVTAVTRTASANGAY